MTAPGIPVDKILAALMSHAQSLGVFRETLGHEPKSAPGESPTLAYWFNGYRPIGAASGLAAASVRVEFSGRIYQNFKTQPEDSIDPAIMTATAQLMNSYVGDFELTEFDASLDGVVRNLDVYGAYGPGLEAKAGYLNQDGSIFRAIVVTLPFLANDAWQLGEG